MRLSSVNFILGNDSALNEYLLKHERESSYMHVTYQGLRTNTTKPQFSHLLKRFWKWYADFLIDAVNEHKSSMTNYNNNGSLHNLNRIIIQKLYLFMVASVVLFFGPIYLISRPFTVLFPLFMVLYLYFGHNVNIWNTTKIDSFQIVMITIYLILATTVIILLYLNAKQQWLMAHILGYLRGMDTTKHSEKVLDERMQNVFNHYYRVTIKPIRRAMIIDTFGDIGGIILSYLKDSDETFEQIAPVVKVKRVV